MSNSNILTAAKVLLIIFATVFYTILILQDNFPIKISTGIVMLGLWGYLTYKFLKHYPPIYTSLMFNEKTGDFNKMIDMPRIFFYSIMWPLMILLIIGYFYGTSSYNYWIDVAVNSSLLMLFVMNFWFLKLTWSPAFEERYIPKIKKLIKTKRKDFDCKYSSFQLERIFDGMVKHGYLEYLDEGLRKEHRKLFVEIFKNEKLPIEPQFDLKLVIADTIHFVEKMDYKIEKMTKPKWGKIFTVDNKRINPGSMYATKSIAEKTRAYSKAMDHIDAIFMEIH